MVWPFLPCPTWREWLVACRGLVFDHRSNLSTTVVTGNEPIIWLDWGMVWLIPFCWYVRYKRASVYINLSSKISSINLLFGAVSFDVLYTMASHHPTCQLILIFRSPLGWSRAMARAMAGTQVVPLASRKRPTQGENFLSDRSDIGDPNVRAGALRGGWLL